MGTSTAQLMPLRSFCVCVHFAIAIAFAFAVAFAFAGAISLCISSFIFALYLAVCLWSALRFSKAPCEPYLMDFQLLNVKRVNRLRCHFMLDIH